MKRVFRSRKRAQAVLEYMLMIAVFVIPVSLIISDLLSDSEPEAKDNLVRVLVSDAMGDEEGFGTIGAPYP